MLQYTDSSLHIHHIQILGPASADYVDVRGMKIPHSRKLIAVKKHAQFHHRTVSLRVTCTRFRRPSSVRTKTEYFFILRPVLELLAPSHAASIDFFFYIFVVDHPGGMKSIQISKFNLSFANTSFGSTMAIPEASIVFCLPAALS